jgi:hypothetical protein
MRKHLFIAAVCALGIAGATAGQASAAAPVPGPVDIFGFDLGELGMIPPPSQVQIFDDSGLVRTIDCPTQQADPVCQGGVAGANAETDAANAFALDGHAHAFREIDPRGKWWSLGANPQGKALVDRIDATGAPGAAEHEEEYLVYRDLDGRTLVVDRDELVHNQRVVVLAQGTPGVHLTRAQIRKAKAKLRHHKSHKASHRRRAAKR